MTVEVGILNKQGIALATDSAATIGDGNKFYNTANKLFSLSKFNPVGVMIYNNAEIMEYPAEILIKEYRRKIGGKSFDHLRDYWDGFLSYLKSLFSKNDNSDYFMKQVQAFLISLDSIIREKAEILLDSLEDSSKEIMKKKVEELLISVINEYHSIYADMEDDENFKCLEEVITSKCYEPIIESIESIIGKLDSEYMQKLSEICIMILTKKHDNGSRTGIVITGFGENELYASLIYGEFLGIFFGEIKYNIKNEINITNDMDAAIIPFAQVDVINTFMNGIDSNMYKEILDFIDDCKNNIAKKSKSNCDVEQCMEKLKEDIEQKIRDMCTDMHWGPIINTVSVAPKEELAQMAETLVNLTSFRRKLAMDIYSESVGGPIDVALITKGDGFIWIKRKHYFDKEYNYNFFQRYDKY